MALWQYFNGIELPEQYCYELPSTFEITLVSMLTNWDYWTIIAQPKEWLRQRIMSETAKRRGRENGPVLEFNETTGQAIIWTDNPTADDLGLDNDQIGFSTT